MNKTFVMQRPCPVCSEFVKTHPTFDRPGWVTQEKTLPNGRWHHMSQRGRIIHRVALRKAKEQIENA